MSLITLPTIKGTTIKNENLAAFVLSIPNKTAVEIVAPDLDIPGKIAIAWDIPTTIAFLKVTFFVVSFALSANKRSRAVMSNIHPTKRICPPNREAISSSKKRPIKTVGIIEAIIFKEN